MADDCFRLLEWKLTPSRMSKAKRQLLLAACIAAGCILLAWRLEPQNWLRQALEWIASLGVWAPVVFVFLYAFAAVLFIPGSLLTLGAGAVFGVVRGSVIVSVAATSARAARFSWAVISREIGWRTSSTAT
jgi:uncharacterized membrane protein YdjX (TVP38/TMEM64 family)